MKSNRKKYKTNMTKINNCNNVSYKLKLNSRQYYYHHYILTSISFNLIFIDFHCNYSDHYFMAINKQHRLEMKDMLSVSHTV